MEIYVGGSSQGKLDYVLDKSGVIRESVIEGSDLDIHIDEKDLSMDRIINNFHLFIKKYTDTADDIYKFMDILYTTNENVIIICSQVGGGVIPIDADEREWRELVGRVMCSAMKRAVHAERIICGMGQVLK